MKALKSELCTMFSIIYFGMIKFMTEPLYRLDEFVFALENSVVLNKKQGSQLIHIFFCLKQRRLIYIFDCVNSKMQIVVISFFFFINCSNLDERRVIMVQWCKRLVLVLISILDSIFRLAAFSLSHESLKSFEFYESFESCVLKQETQKDWHIEVTWNKKAVFCVVGWLFKPILLL